MVGPMDMESRSVELCIAGSQAEFDHDNDEARRLYAEAWDAAANDYDACIAAHYLGHLESDPLEALRWHREALARVQRLDPQVQSAFLPSLYLNLGHSHERVGNADQAAKYYAIAADLGLAHQPT